MCWTSSCLRRLTVIVLGQNALASRLVRRTDRERERCGEADRFNDARSRWPSFRHLEKEKRGMPFVEETTCRAGRGSGNRRGV